MLDFALIYGIIFQKYTALVQYLQELQYIS